MQRSNISAADTGYWPNAIISDPWVLDFLRNCFGYATVLVPGFLLVRYYQRRKEWLDISLASSMYKRLITLFVFGWKPLEIASKSTDRPSVIDYIRSAKYGKHCLFSVCFMGLLCSHLIWGFYQEKMMTRDYYLRDNNDGSKPERFKDSQFIVFLNRISALAVSITYLLITWLIHRSKRGYEHSAPFYKYSYASLSNILSSWCQYEALKYISFPTQVLGKASKIIPTMMVGRILRNKSYPYHQYATSALISAGVSVFLFSRSGDAGRRSSKFSDTTTISGIILMCGYLLFDSFTSNWQSSLFQEYGVGEMQMMCGVNLFSTLFTFIPLLEQGTLFGSLRFMARHNEFAFDCVSASMSSTVGQLFIFFTISEFGPVALAVIMTIRQAFAILISCLYYGHTVNGLGVFGLCLVFAALLAGQYLNKVYGGSGHQRVQRRR